MQAERDVVADDWKHLKSGFLILGIAGVLFTCAYCFFGYRVYDDAWITYRYSRNLVEGFGLRWNPGEPPMEAFTSLLHVLMSAPAEMLGGDPVLWNHAVAIYLIIAMMVGYGLLTLPGRKGGALSYGLLLALFVSNPFIAYQAGNGMETTLAAAVLMLATWRALRAVEDLSQLWTFCVSSFIGLLVRPEFVILLSFYSLFLLIVHRKQFLQTIKGFICFLGLPSVLYLFWKFWYFGDILPNSFYFKADGDTLLSEKGFLLTIRFLVVYLLPLAGLMLLLFWLRFAKLVHLVFMLFIVVAVSYYSRVDPFMAWVFRFQVPYYPSALLILSGPLSRVFAEEGDRARKGQLLTLVSIVVLIGLSFTLFVRHKRVVVNYVEPRPVSATIGRLLQGLPDAHNRVVCTDEAGAIPYFMGMRHIDPYGLTTKDPRTATRYPFDVNLVFEASPDVIILHTIDVVQEEQGGFHLPPERVRELESVDLRSREYFRYAIVQDERMAEYDLLSKVAAVHDPRAHEYFYLFVRRDSPLHAEITDRLHSRWAPYNLQQYNWPEWDQAALPETGTLRTRNFAGLRLGNHSGIPYHPQP